jgi:hypothetical protein
MSLAMPVAVAPNAAAFFNEHEAATTDRPASPSPSLSHGASVNGNGHGHAGSPPPSAGAGPSAYAFGPQAQSIGANGNLREEAVREGDRHCAIAVHLSPLAFFWIGPFAFAIPLVLWLVRKDESTFVSDHGREMVNFLISFVLLHVLLALTVIGVALWPVLWIVTIVSMIRGAIAANRSEYFRYPVNMRFLT